MMGLENVALKSGTTDTRCNSEFLSNSVFREMKLEAAVALEELTC